MSLVCDTADLCVCLCTVPTSFRAFEGERKVEGEIRERDRERER